MMDAGSDTTGIALNNVMLLLLKNPHCLKRLREEIVGVLDQDEVIAPYDKVKHLPYLRACFDENMRMFRPVLLHVPRRTPRKGTTVRGEFVAGEDFGRDSNVCDSSQRGHIFRPGSIQAGAPARGGRRDLQPYFVAFSAGVRGYIGRNISYLEQTILQASLVHRFEFSLPLSSWESVTRETTNLTPGPMLLKVWKRADEMCADM